MFWLFNLLILIQFHQIGSTFSPADFVWKNRLVIIYGECDCSKWFSNELQKDLSDRKLLVFHFDEELIIESNFKGVLKTVDFLKVNPKKSSQSVSWVLIGLDGGVKKSENTIPNPGEIFKIIDAMPMRQSEIEKKGNAGQFSQ